MLSLVGCTPSLQTKPWHTSSGMSGYENAYPLVEWTIVKQLMPGMSASEAKSLVRDLQWYNHSVNAIVYSTYAGHDYEIALRMLADKRTITDTSYKRIH